MREFCAPLNKIARPRVGRILSWALPTAGGRGRGPAFSAGGHAVDWALAVATGISDHGAGMSERGGAGARASRAFLSSS
eukprot:5463978-Pyramimonas_sp.AAC.1